MSPIAECSRPLFHQGTQVRGGQLDGFDAALRAVEGDQLGLVEPEGRLVEANALDQLRLHQLVREARPDCALASSGRKRKAHERVHELTGEAVEFVGSTAARARRCYPTWPASAVGDNCLGGRRHVLGDSSQVSTPGCGGTRRPRDAHRCRRDLDHRIEDPDQARLGLWSVLVGRQQQLFEQISGHGGH